MEDIKFLERDDDMITQVLHCRKTSLFLTDIHRNVMGGVYLQLTFKSPSIHVYVKGEKDRKQIRQKSFTAMFLSIACRFLTFEKKELR